MVILFVICFDNLNHTMQSCGSGANILVPGSNHRSIDNDLVNLGILQTDIRNFIEVGSGCVDLAKDSGSKIPTQDPSKSGSKDIPIGKVKDVLLSKTR